MTSIQRREELQFLTEFLSGKGYHNVEILFGAFWGNDYLDWIPVSVKLHKIDKKIALAEANSTGSLEEDDFFVIIIELQTEVLFCHEHDIHLAHNKENEVKAAILNHWRTLEYNVKQQTSLQRGNG